MQYTERERTVYEAITAYVEFLRQQLHGRCEKTTNIFSYPVLWAEFEPDTFQIQGIHFAKLAERLDPAVILWTFNCDGACSSLSRVHCTAASHSTVLYRCTWSSIVKPPPKWHSVKKSPVSIPSLPRADYEMSARRKNIPDSEHVLVIWCFQNALTLYHYSVQFNFQARLLRKSCDVCPHLKQTGHEKLIMIPTVH
jgi:hypothetical protein